MVDTGNENDRLIFIGGSPRSGTTLVQNMLDCHPSVVGGPEFLHLPDIIDLRKKLHASIDREWIDIFCSRQDVDRHLVRAINRLFLPLADRQGCRYYSEKTPGNVLVFAELMELFPQAHFIQVVRDPRAILSSMHQVRQRAISKNLNPPWFTATLPISIGYVKRCLDAGLRADRLAPGRVLTVVYEQLVKDPEGGTRAICRHLGIDWDQRMLRPGDQQHLGDKALTAKSDELWYDKKTYRQNVSAQAVEKWRSDFTLFQQVVATLAFTENPAYAAWGYDFSLADLAQGRPWVSRVMVHLVWWSIRGVRGVRRGLGKTKRRKSLKGS